MALDTYWREWDRFETVSYGADQPRHGPTSESQTVTTPVFWFISKLPGASSHQADVDSGTHASYYKCGWPACGPPSQDRQALI